MNWFPALSERECVCERDKREREGSRDREKESLLRFFCYLVSFDGRGDDSIKIFKELFSQPKLDIFKVV